MNKPGRESRAESRGSADGNRRRTCVPPSTLGPRPSTNPHPQSARRATIRPEPTGRHQRVVSRLVDDRGARVADMPETRQRAICQRPQPRPHHRESIPTAERKSLVRHGCSRSRCLLPDSVWRPDLVARRRGWRQRESGDRSSMGRHRWIRRRPSGWRDDALRGHPLFPAVDHLCHRADHLAGGFVEELAQRAWVRPRWRNPPG